MFNLAIETDFNGLQDKLLMEIELKPIQGDRFQPTGFPNLGAAVYETPKGDRNILVESPQSMANRLEKICLKDEGPFINEELTGLSYILAHINIKKSKETEAMEIDTSSLVEAHRLNSPFIIKNQDFKDEFGKRSGYDGKGKYLDWHKTSEAVFYYDVNSLIHGTFLSNFHDGRVKFPRILSAFIEAMNVKEAESGGTKFNSFDPSGNIKLEGDTKNVYGNVPYQRTEYVANSIKAYFNIDVNLLKSYRLDESAELLLLNLSMYKITRFCESGLRLRTACDLTVNGKLTATNSNYEIHDSSYYLSRVKKLIQECKNENLFAGSPYEITTEAIYAPKKDKKDKNGNKENEQTSGNDDNNDND